MRETDPHAKIDPHLEHGIAQVGKSSIRIMAAFNNDNPFYSGALPRLKCS